MRGDGADVATVALPRLSAKRVRSRLIPLRRRAAKLVKPVRPVAKNLASVPLHIAGLASIDFAFFHLSHFWGWLVLGPVLIWLEHVIADEP